MAAEIRVDRITSRAGINTINLTSDGFSFLGNIGIGTTNAVIAVNAANTQKLNVGIITANQAFINNVTITNVSTLSNTNVTTLNVTGITTLGQTTTIGLSNAGVSTLGNATASTLVVTGFSTFSGGASATLLNVSGVSTFSGGVNASQGIDAAGLRVSGIATHGQTTTVGLSNAGISTLGDATATTLVVSGVSTIGFATASNLTVTGIVTAFGGLQGIGIQTNGVNVTTGIITALNFVGTGNTITYDSGTKTVSINIAGSAGGSGGGVSEVDTIVQTTNAVGVGSFVTATHRSAVVTAQINQNAQYQIGQYLMIHDGTTVTVVEKAAVSTGSSMLGSFTGGIAGANAELRVSMVSSGIATVTTKIDTVTI